MKENMKRSDEYDISTRDGKARIFHSAVHFQKRCIAFNDLASDYSRHTFTSQMRSTSNESMAFSDSAGRTLVSWSWV